MLNSSWKIVNDNWGGGGLEREHKSEGSEKWRNKGRGQRERES